MAEKNEEIDAGEALGRAVRNGIRNLMIVVVAIGVVYAMFHVFFGEDPARAALRTPEETIAAYTAFVSPYISPNAPTPTTPMMEAWLSFFDRDSRKFFEDNRRQISKLKLSRDPEAWAALDDHGQRITAMSYVYSLPPLSGIARINEQRPGEGGRLEIVVTDRQGRQRSMPMVKDGDLFYFAELGGLKDHISQEVVAVKDTP